MRESSKRPAMAFVFFTRLGPPPPDSDDIEAPRPRALPDVSDEAPSQRAERARARLVELAGGNEDDDP
jgi:hypothetical protein